MFRAFFQRGAFSKRGVSMQDVAVASALGLVAGYYIVYPIIKEGGERALQQKQAEGGAAGAPAASPASKPTNTP